MSDLCLCRERKREADDNVDEPESKRMKTEDDVQEEDATLSAPMDAPADDAQEGEGEETTSVTEDVSMLPESVDSETTTPAPEVPEVNPEINRNRRKKRSQDGGGFKENPYTFLKPNDPILLNCM